MTPAKRYKTPLSRQISPIRCDVVVGYRINFQCFGSIASAESFLFRSVLKLRIAAACYTHTQLINCRALFVSSGMNDLRKLSGFATINIAMSQCRVYSPHSLLRALGIKVNATLTVYLNEFKSLTCISVLSFASRNHRGFRRSPRSPRGKIIGSCSSCSSLIIYPRSARRLNHFSAKLRFQFSIFFLVIQIAGLYPEPCKHSPLPSPPALAY